MRYILILLSACGLYAQPYLTCAPYSTNAGIIFFEVYMDSGLTNPISSVPFTNSNGTVKLRYDLDKISVGTHTCYLTAVAVDPLWGTNRSVPSDPFVFTRPAGPAKPIAPAIEK